MFEPGKKRNAVEYLKAHIHRAHVGLCHFDLERSFSASLHFLLIIQPSLQRTMKCLPLVSMATQSCSQSSGRPQGSRKTSGASCLRSTQSRHSNRGGNSGSPHSAQGSSQPVASCAPSPMDRVTEHFSHRMQKFHFVAQVKILRVISIYHPKTTINIMEDSIYTEAYLNRPEFRRSEGLIKLRTARISSAAESTASTRR